MTTATTTRTAAGCELQAEARGWSTRELLAVLEGLDEQICRTQPGQGTATLIRAKTVVLAELDARIGVDR